MLLKIIDKDFLEETKECGLSQIRIDTQKLKNKTSEKENIEKQLKEINAKLIQLRQIFEDTDYHKLTEKLENSINKLSEEKSSEEKRKQQRRKTKTAAYGIFKIFNKLSESVHKN